MELNNLESAFDLQELLGTDNEGAGSISRGVFSYRGVAEKRKDSEDDCDTPTKRIKGSKKKVAKKSPRKKSKQIQVESDESHNRELRLFSAASSAHCNDTCERQRFKNYIKIEKETTRVMQNLQNINYARIVGQVVEYIKKVSVAEKEKNIKNDFSSENDGSTFSFKGALQASEIPTAALLTGINIPDHADFYQLLAKEIRSKRVSPHIASIQAKECGTNLRTLMKVIIRQLLGISHLKEKCDDSDNESDEEEEEKVFQNGYKCLSGRNSASIASLRLWYENQYPSFQNGVERPPLIIVFEDFESFVPKTLQELIRNLSLLSDKFCGVNDNDKGLPFVLIFGIATTVDIIHRTLPHSITSQLAIEKFAAEPSINLLAKVIEQILLKNSAIPFKIEGAALENLIETFLFSDFSVKHFVMAYKCCLLEHYSQNFVSVLCCEDDDEIEAVVENMTKKDIDNFRRLTSFKTFLDKEANNVIKSEVKHETDIKREEPVISEPNKSIASKLKSDKDLKKFIINQVHTLRNTIETFNIFVDALFQIMLDVPGQPLGKHFYTVYSNAMEKSVHKQDYYRTSFSYLNLCEKSGMLKHLNNFVSSLKPYPKNAEASAAVSKAEQFIKELENLDQLNYSNKIEKSEEVKTSSPVSVKTPKGKFDRSQWQEQLRESAKEKEKCRLKLNPFEALRKQVNEFYNSTFTRILSHDENLNSPSFYPLNEVFHEIFYFIDNKRNNCNQRLETTFIDERLHGAPRLAIQTALRTPNVYLKSFPQLDSESEKYDVSLLPDLCIAYKLYRENSRYINLFDWLNCWISIVTNGSEEYAPDSKNKLQVDPKFQARFGRCVSELQYLGFIRPSKRKTDHVEKLTPD